MLRQRASFLNREGTFGNQEGMITDVFLDADWQSTPAFNLVPLLKRILKRNFRNASLLSIILSYLWSRVHLIFNKMHTMSVYDSIDTHVCISSI